MTIYEFKYCPCTYESSSVAISLHRTKAGAYKAMRKHIYQAHMDWYDRLIRCGKVYQHPFGMDEKWSIGEQELQD